ncbi:elongation factor 2 [Trichonephila inaurata madagascariensis]|uniref:Elongation factor 2 n=1 Tax=Trichonephila inaurata madagascariensis TaxID=2747483 RepID=A0A8X7BX90_9ARAC|nr:elongation factor 2 [Trichonephila inaurata madagascariensis]
MRDCETVSEYFLKMKELYNSGKIDGSAFMHYVIKDALIDSGSRVILIRKSVCNKINHVQLFPSNSTLSGFINNKVRLFGYFKDDILIDDLKCSVEICVVDDDAMFYDVIIGLNALMHGETINKENGFTIKNKPKCNENSKNKSITPNFVPVKKDSLHVKDDQRTVTVSPVVKVAVELQNPSDLPKLEDGLKHLEKFDPMIQCIIEKHDAYIVSDSEELDLENCLKDVKEDKAYIPLKKTNPLAVVPENMPKEVKRRAHEKRRPRIKERKDYYFIYERKQKIENSIANCDHRVLANHKRRKKEDVPLKIYHTDHLGPHRLTNFEERVMEQTVRFEQDLQELTTKDAEDTAKDEQIKIR